MEDVVIVSAARTPIGKFNGAFAGMSAPQLGAAAIRAAVERAGIDPASVSECIMGNVVGAGLGQAPARQAAIGGGLPDSVGALTINKVCGSGLKAAMLGAALIRSGNAEVIVAGGMENMSRVPYLLQNARNGYRLGNGELVDAVVHDGLWCAFEHQHMGNSAEWIARAHNVTREQQDAFAFQSQQRAIAAMDAGRLKDEIAPVSVPGPKGQTTVVDTDENPRRDTSMPALAKLRPAFAADGSVTAGNAPGITDGAAALVLMSASRAAALGLTPLARIVNFDQAAVKPLEVFTAPTFAVQRLMQRSGTSIDDYDLFEINEAFAAQVVANVRALGIDPDRLNVNGGAIALGHPIGASGARVVVTLIHALRQRGAKRGLAALCLGGGEGVAMDIEVL
ncbi:acetyl-CoA acetyltransferase [Oscillochloris trichoides DG-6]|uniref:acetyl-CoA C-acetyltransferase n=1 Tax=Oscillochloris trichoides DG-6 TaxID=765420 RepID=E1IG36_9CHLR|nr:acetyl-CoA C-acetyltransferase [Oscillochloris trichoides]EFO79853.1 acetyl-CoA acetyltransferase [Oscillochloris trichoides DG-6]